MFGSLDPAKLLLVLVIALVVLGPERLPRAARQLGAAWRELTKVREQVSQEIRSAVPDLGIPQLPRVRPGMVSGFLNDLTRATSGPGTPGAASGPGTPGATSGLEPLEPSTYESAPTPEAGLVVAVDEYNANGAARSAGPVPSTGRVPSTGAAPSARSLQWDLDDPSMN